MKLFKKKGEKAPAEEKPQDEGKKPSRLSGLFKKKGAAKTEAKPEVKSGSTEEFTGLSKHFNSWTPTGRANVAKATYATIAAIFLFRYIYKKLVKPVEAK